jgi:hypothetical protein
MIDWWRVHVPMPLQLAIVVVGSYHMYTIIQPLIKKWLDHHWPE